MKREWKPGDVAMVNDTTGGPDEPATCIKAAVKGEREAEWLLHRNGSRVWSSVSDAHPLAVIDPEDREQVELLARTLDDEFGKRGWANQSTPDPDVVDAVQAALREFANPTPKREWRDGDVVQHVNDNYAAQRHDGKWFTTSGGGVSWRSDEYVTNHVGAGQLRVLREQAAEVTA